MRYILIFLLSLTLLSCSGSKKKSEDVLKVADDLSAYIANQRSNLGNSYKTQVRTYRQMLSAGFNKRKAPMPALLGNLTKMRKLALDVRAKMSSMTAKTTRLQDIGEAQEEIPKDQSEYAEVDELKEDLQLELGQLEVMAKQYGVYTEDFKRLVKGSGIYTIPTQDLRDQAEDYEDQIEALVDQARKTAKSADQKESLSEMEKKAERALKFIDQLLPRLKDDEVIVGPKSDPRNSLVRIQKLSKEIKDLSEEI